MTFTFGICTEFSDAARLTEMVDSIRALKIPNVEIILAGSYGENEVVHYDNVRYIMCDGWITKKKNMIAKCASNDTLVLAHDYYVFDLGWYAAYENYSAFHEFDICSNPQFLIDGSRHATDWITWDHPQVGRYYSLEYTDWQHTRYQYISGGYFLVNKNFMRENPFDETLPPGSPEDVEWSLRVREKARIKCNHRAVVRHNKRHRDVGNKSFPYYSIPQTGVNVL